MPIRVRITQFMRLILPVAAMAISLTWGTASLGQSGCQIPQFVMQSTVGANVMMLCDNSGSMNEIIYHPDYNAHTTYTGRFSRDDTYFVASDGNRTPRSFNSSWESTPSAYLNDSDNGQYGRYQGNYLNWVYYHATNAQRTAMPRVTRVQVLKLVMNDVISMSNRIRFGLTVFQNEDGGRIIGKCGSTRTSLRAQINGITANAWTPTGEAMEDILDYFVYSGPDAAIAQPCQHNFLVVITDGFPTMDRDVSGYLLDADHDGRDPGNCASIGAPYDESNNCSDHMDDVAYYLAHTDLRPDLPDTQSVYTYVIGYDANAPLLQETADNGNGLFFTAANADQLRMSIVWAVQDIIRRISAGSAVAVVSTESGTEDRLFRGKFMPLSWDGYLESYALPYTPGDSPIWEAGALLAARSPDSRWIFAGLGTTVHDFQPGTASILRTAMGAPDDATAANWITWGRGNNIDGFRDRCGWILGDIVHSTPVVIGAPAAFSATPAYMDFMQEHAARERVVYVGANDGMLHAFRADDGEELWGFVPAFALPKFAAMADTLYCHTYSVDQTVTALDAQINGAWRTVLIGGSREGGAALFALDVTAASNPILLWQITTPDLAPFPSAAVVATLESDAVALVGSGLDYTTGSAYLHSFDLATGALRGSRLLSRVNNTRNKATAPKVVDTNLDGIADLVYVGDLIGNLWRIKLNGSGTPANWSVLQLYRGTTPITATPTVAFGDGSNLWVYCGTGAYLDEADMVSTIQNRFLCIIDRNNGVTATLTSLVNQSGSIQDIGNRDGWYVTLANESGERVTETAVVTARAAIFTSYAPTMTACVAGGTSYLYRLGYDTGGYVATDDGSEPPPRIESLGEGIASHPVVDLVNGNVVIQSSDASVHVEEIGVFFSRITVRDWHETF